MSETAFARFWRTDLTRDCFLSLLSLDDLQNIRFVSHDFEEKATPYLFQNTNITFKTHTFSRHARLIALARIGHHIKHLSFILPHSVETFLPPLLAPDTLEEVNFVYEPQAIRSRPSSSSSNTSSPKYGSWETDDLLLKHYPPLFHAATNISAFIKAFNAMPNIKSLRISCPGQTTGQSYRCCVVDYALISLRIAVEQTNPKLLTSLSLDQVHPSAPLYLRPQLSVGASPASTRVWRQIRKLSINMESFAYGRDSPSDHLKVLHTYLQTFVSIQHLEFCWLGTKGPCPLSLDAEPCTSRPASLDCANACPNSCVLPPCKPLKFRHLQTMHLRNASLDSSQAATFITSHRKVLHEFEFDECHLRSGTWDDALAPLSRIAGSDTWKQKQEEVMDVPLLLSPVETKNEEEYVESRLWDDHRRHRGLQVLRKVGAKTKEVVPEHLKRLLKNARLGWH